MSTRSAVVEIAASAVPAQGLVSLRVTLNTLAADGTLWVQDEDGRRFPCDWLQTPWAVSLAIGDELIVLVPHKGGRGVVMGRIGRYAQGLAATQLAFEATQSLSLRCGESSIDLRADGKVMIRGEDVLVRAKGTKRIRAGTVSIN